MQPTLARSPDQVGHIIARARRGKGLTQTQLAELCGQRQELISRIETGHVGVRLGTIFGVMAALDLEITVNNRTRSSAADIQAIS